MTSRLTQEERVKRSTDRLIQAAVDLFSDRGYAAATPAAIAERAGYDRAMVRVRFGSKLGLFETLLRTRFQDRLLGPAADPEQSGLARIFQGIEALRDLLREDPVFLHAVWKIGFEALGPASELAPFFDAWLTTARTAVAAALRSGVADGSIKPMADPDAIAGAIINQTLGLAYQSCLWPGAFDVEAGLDMLEGALTDHLATPRSRPARG